MKQLFDQVSAACCRTITRRYSTSFSLGIRFLDRSVRSQIYAVYAFVRLADEIVDSFHAYDKATLLARFKADCYEAIADGISLNPVLNVFQQVVNDYRIDHRLIDLFLESMEMDLEQKKHDPQSMEKYILGSARVVGLMCLWVFVGGDRAEYERLKHPAMKLGSALQKINFLRDISSDYLQLGRTYFPGVDFTQFTQQQKNKIELEIEEEFRAALDGIRMLPASSSKGVYLAFAYYHSLLKKIRCKPAALLMHSRVRITAPAKAFFLVRAMLRYCFWGV